MHQEIVTLRQTLKTALRHGWLDRLPDFSEPYRKSPKISHRAWFSLEEYKQLYNATRNRAQQPKRRGFKWETEQLHDYVLFAVNTGLRPDEAWRLQFRDVTIVYEEDLKKTILEIVVRGKRGVGYCKSTPGAVLPFKRLRSRLRPARIYGANAPSGTSETPAISSGEWRTPESTDLIFPKWQRELFKTILDEEKLRIDREGQPRTAYSLRHTYTLLLVCLREEIASFDAAPDESTRLIRTRQQLRDLVGQFLRETNNQVRDVRTIDGAINKIEELGFLRTFGTPESPVRVYSAAKTVADCFKFRNKIGLDIAIEALKDCLHQKKASLNEIYHYAKVCRVGNVIRPYMEAL
jgi:integrase